MDPATIALIIQATVKTAAEVRAIFANNELTDGEKELKYAEYLASIKENQTRTYENYDAHLDRDLAENN